MSTLRRLAAATFAVVLLASVAARADRTVPLLVSLQGRLLDSADKPVNGPVTLACALYDVDEASATAKWTATYQVNVANGVYALQLGDTAGGQPALASALFGSGKRLWLGLSVNGTAEARPRLPVGSVPWAMQAERAFRADDADTLGGEGPEAFHDAAQLTGQVPAAALSAALLDVTADGPLVATRAGTALNLGLPRASGSAAGYLAAEDFARFDAAAPLAGSPAIDTVGTITNGTWQGSPVDDAHVASAEAWHHKLDDVAHDGSLRGSGRTGAELGVVFGSAAKTAAEGNDPRLSDARAPTAGSPNYLQNGTSAQDASFHVTGTGEVGGTLTAGAFAGDGAGLTNLAAAALTGTVADARLTANVPLLGRTALQTFAGPLAAGSFAGDGAGLTKLDPAHLSTGVAGIDITGNAATVTNGVYTTGSYANPAWISSIAGSKVTGSVASAAAFTGTLSGDVAGTQAATVVTALQGTALATTAPGDAQALVFDGTAGHWKPAAVVNGLLAGAGVDVSAANGTVTLANTGLLSLKVTAPLASTGGQDPTLSLGTVDVAHGGTGVTAAGAAGNVLRSTGSGWASAPLTIADLPDLASIYADLATDQVIDGAKTFVQPIVGDILGNAATVTDGVYSTGSYADPAWITAISGAKVTGSVANADAVTNGVYTTGSYADPAWISSISGSKVTGTVASAKNADTVTNGVYTTGSYADPAWITAISGAKVSGSVANANTVTNGVYTTGSYADPAWITSISGAKVTGSVANANTVTNGVYTTGSYADPAWITSISGAKVTGSVANANTVTNGVYTTGSYADPAWMTSISGAKVTGSVGNANTVTNGVYTTGSYADPSWITSISAGKVTGTVANATNFAGSLAGDVTGTQGATVVSKLRGVTLSSTAPTSGQVLGFSGGSWAPVNAGTVTQVSASAPLSVANGTTTPTLTIAAAASGQDGYLKGTDWDAFNAKVSTIVGGPGISVSTVGSTVTITSTSGGAGASGAVASGRPPRTVPGFTGELGPDLSWEGYTQCYGWKNDGATTGALYATFRTRCGPGTTILFGGNRAGQGTFIRHEAELSKAFVAWLPATFPASLRQDTFDIAGRYTWWIGSPWLLLAVNGNAWADPGRLWEPNVGGSAAATDGHVLSQNGDQANDQNTVFGDRYFTYFRNPVTSCKQLNDAGITTNGTYLVALDGQNLVNVYCDMTGAGGPWTLVANQVSTSLLPDVQTDVLPANFGNNSASFRVGAATVRTIVPAVAWKLSDGANNVFFKPTCQVDWTKNYLNQGATDCTTGYTSTAFTTATNGGFVNVSTRGIGINNSGTFCSIRMYEANDGHAYGCNYTTAPTVGLWFR